MYARPKKSGGALARVIAVVLHVTHRQSSRAEHSLLAMRVGRLNLALRSRRVCCRAGRLLGLTDGIDAVLHVATADGEAEAVARRRGVCRDPAEAQSDLRRSVSDVQGPAYLAFDAT